MFVGKPVVVYIDGERREIGKITRASIRNGRLYTEAHLRLAPDSEGEAEGEIFKELHDES